MIDAPPTLLGRRTLLAALAVAVLDLSFAATWWVVVRHLITVERLLQGIASGLLGASAFTGGTSTAIIGAAVHCCVALGWTVLFVLLLRTAPGFERLLQRPYGVLKAGAPFGMMVWLLMNFVILPLTHASSTKVMTAWFWGSLAWHAVGVGMVMAAILKGDNRS